MTTADSPLRSKGWRILYWIATAFIAGTAAVSGAMDILHLPPLFGIMLHLGYPAYFGAILGIWKVLGALALLAPRFPRLKEWAYAGMFIDFTSAAASHATVGDGVAVWIGPLASIPILAASWALRPPSRRLPDPTPP
jgi:uncharacterized membrane protein YphA (DoxX/SURF4 family)